MTNKSQQPWYQRLLIGLGIILAAFLLLGGIFDTVGNGLSLITPQVATLLTTALLIIWVAAEIKARWGNANWYVGNNQNVIIKRLSSHPRLFMIGILAAVWIPQLLRCPKGSDIGEVQPEKQILLSTEKGIYPELEYGDSGSVMSFKNMGPKFNVLGIGGDVPLTISADKGKVMVNATIRNKTGSLVAIIEENEWKLNPGRWDRNYNDSALEVKDDTGDIVLQIRHKSNRVQLQAKFYDLQGNGVFMGRVKDPQGRVSGGIRPINLLNPYEYKILPIFKYPSETHLGETGDEAWYQKWLSKRCQ